MSILISFTPIFSAKQYKKQQAEIADIKQFIASCGTYANLVRQAKSRQKILDKMEADGLIEMPYEEPIFRFKFTDAGEFNYSFCTLE